MIIRKYDGKEIEYDSDSYTFRVIKGDLEVVHRNVPRVRKVYKNGEWAAVTEHPTTTNSSQQNNP